MFFMRIIVLFIYFKGGKSAAVHFFFITRHRMWSLDLQLSISRVQFCSSSGYLLRSIMQAAVVVILNHNRNKRQVYIGLHG